MIYQDHLRKTLLDRKFKESATHPGVFQHETLDIFLCVHVVHRTAEGTVVEGMWIEDIVDG